MTVIYERAILHFVATGATHLRRLSDETFGDRMARARGSSRVGLRGAAALITDQVVPVSFTTLSRLEDLPETPVDLRKRLLATLALLAYGFDPEDFGLSTEDLPRSVDVEAFIAAADQKRGAGPSSAWFTEVDPPGEAA